MIPPIHRVPALLLLALLSGCALGHPATTAAPASESLLAGIGGVDVLVFTDLPDDYAGPRGLRSLAVREHVRSRLAEAGVPLRPETESFAMDLPNFRLDLTSLAVAPDGHAVWARVALGETTRLRRRPDLPLMITTWQRSGRIFVRGDDVAPLWREVDRLTAEFVREYREVNRTPGTDPV